MSLKARLILIPRFNACLNYAKTIITISETEKKALQTYTNAEIMVIYPSISDAVVGKTSDIIEKLELKKKRYLLTVSTIEPRKNFGYLLTVLSKINLAKYDLTLVVVGRSGWGKQLPSTEKNVSCKTTGYVSDYDLSALYQNALFYLSLSVHEGFGYTPVEALLNNTQVCVSDIPIFHEILKDGACFIPLNDVGDASKKLEELFNVSYGAVDYMMYYKKYKEENTINLIPDNFFEGVCDGC
jgi:glycosyltransferase involved in cell wall biosynthesis